MGLTLTKQEVMKEIVRCGKKPEYFIHTYAKITHPQRGLIPFHLYPFQENLLESFEDHRFNVILKARQLGISTITAAYVAWMMMFRREKNVLVIATKFSTASNLVKKVLALKEKKSQIVDKKRINIILKNIKRKSLRNNIDPKVTRKIWINMISAYIDYERRNFKKK